MLQRPILMTPPAAIVAVIRAVETARNVTLAKGESA